jgi:hypothetical protein
MKTARFLALLALSLLALPAQATRLYYSNQCSSIGGFDTTANMAAIYTAATFPCGNAWTQDQGFIVSDGTNWTPLTAPAAESTITFASGPLTAVLGTKGTYSQIVHTTTVDNMVASAAALVCVTNPTIALLECGTSASCASPATIASVQVTGTGAATPASVSSATITAGDYVAWQLTGGICTSLNLAANAQVHAN